MGVLQHASGSKGRAGAGGRARPGLWRRRAWLRAARAPARSSCALTPSTSALPRCAEISLPANLIESGTQCTTSVFLVSVCRALSVAKTNVRPVYAYLRHPSAYTQTWAPNAYTSCQCNSRQAQELEYERQLTDTLRKRSRSPGSAEQTSRRLAII